MNAYRAYNDDQALEHAKLMWNYSYTYFVTPQHVAAGKHPKKTVKLAKTCGGSEWPFISCDIVVLISAHSHHCGGRFLCESGT